MLYDDAFIAGIPDPVSNERRSLVNLKANAPWLLIKLNNWYSELLPAGDPELAARLRNTENSEEFTAGFWELVIFRHLRTISHNILYKQVVDGKTPDLYWPEANLIADVISISDPNYGEREDVFIHELSQAINGLALPFGIMIASSHFSSTSYKKQAILKWVLSLVNQPNLYDEAQWYNDGESRLELLIKPRTNGPIIKAIGMFHLDAEQTKKIVKRRIREKLRKYQRPLVVFACSGQGFWNLEEDTLDMALYGDWQVVFNRDPNVKETREDRVANGIFNNRQNNGQPANRRVIAAAFVDRFNQGEKLFLRFKVYHNPFADPPLPSEFFGSHVQLVVQRDSGAEVVMTTINEGNKVVEVN